MRVNTKNSDAIVLPLDVSWEYNQTDHTCDIAIAHFQLETAFDVTTVMEEMLGTSTLLQEKNLGLGSDVYVIGLMAYHAGSKRNLPILRHGQIAMMDQERIRTATGFEIEAFVIEGRSIGGLSGSPAFVLTEGAVRNVYLLGVVSGHWDIPLVSTAPVEKGAVKSGDLIDMFERANAGLALVTPSQRIREILDQPSMRDFREQEERRYSANDKPIV